MSHKHAWQPRPDLCHLASGVYTCNTCGVYGERVFGGKNDGKIIERDEPVDDSQWDWPDQATDPIAYYNPRERDEG